MGKERRLNERVEPEPAAPISVQIMGADFIERVHVIDISVGGLGIRVPHEFIGYNVTDRVEIVLKLPGQAPFMADGFIRHFNGASRKVFGVEFVRLPEQGREKIAAYVNLRLGRR